MIVVDTNVIAYFYLPSSYSGVVDRLHSGHSDWIAPALWKSEFRNVLTLYIRKRLITLDSALEIIDEAESMMGSTEFDVSSYCVLSLVANSQCSAYDCEFVALAQQLDIRLITQDQKVLREFPETALSIHQALQIL